MSWLRSAVNRAVEVRGNNNISRTFLSVADSVAQHAGQAVAGVPKLLQDRLGAQKTQNFKLAVKRLEEVSVSCRGVERVQLLRRWLVSLKEIERFYGSESETMCWEKDAEHLPTSTRLFDSPKKPDLVLYYDPDVGGEPMNFRDVFLRSQAPEGVILSMILKAPDEEELALLLGLFRICLIGGEEVHVATVQSIKELAKNFSSYKDELLAKKEELLQCVQDAIAGLKVNADMLRIDSEISKIQERLNEMNHKMHLTEGDELSEYRTLSTTKDLKVALEEIQLCSRLEALLKQKKNLKLSESPKNHAKKVDKLKVLLESLANSASKAEKRITDNRCQKEEALKFRVSKTSEISQLEKEITAEVEGLKRRKDELEAELKMVNVSLTSACARLRNAQEEREQFDDASIKILQHFKVKEDELSRSISSYRTESDVCNAFINFLESTWVSQSTYAEQKEKQVNEELERYEVYLVNMAVSLLSSYKDDLGPLISSFAQLSEKLRSSGTAMNDEKKDDAAPRENLETEYLKAESKLSSIFNITETLRRQFQSQDDGNYKTKDERVKELFESVEKFKHEFDSIERPSLNVDTPVISTVSSSKEETSEEGTRRRWFAGKDNRSRSQRSLLEESSEILSDYEVEYSEKALNKKKISFDPKLQLSNLQLELELENSGKDHHAEELHDWEFDHIA